MRSLRVPAGDAPALAAVLRAMTDGQRRQTVFHVP